MSMSPMVGTLAGHNPTLFFFLLGVDVANGVVGLQSNGRTTFLEQRPGNALLKSKTTFIKPFIATNVT